MKQTLSQILEALEEWYTIHNRTMLPQQERLARVIITIINVILKF